MILAHEVALLAHAKDTPSHGLKLQRHGMPITIEHPKGSTRVLHDDKGNEVYKKRMFHSYGYLDKTKGRDGDEVDCFLGPNQNSKCVYVIHMIDLGPVPSEREDEDKCFIGFDSSEAAKQAFFLHYARSFFGGMTELSVADFKKKMKTASLPYRSKMLRAGARRYFVKAEHRAKKTRAMKSGAACPNCGAKKYHLMPTDFETAKCDDCGKNWELKPKIQP